MYKFNYFTTKKLEIFTNEKKCYIIKKVCKIITKLTYVGGRKRMKNIRKIISIIMLVMICTVFLGNGYNVSAEVKTEKSTIWVIGDSTVLEFDDNYYYPRYGYGTQLQQYFDSSKYEVKNLALSGRSSKNYITNSNYKTL